MYITKPIQSVKTFSSIEQLTEEDPSHKDMRIISVLPTFWDVGERQQIKLCLISMGCSIYWEENDPSEDGPTEADECQHLEETKVKVSIE
jgi:hypothetical protein